jgi:hypothetical protein
MRPLVLLGSLLLLAPALGPALAAEPSDVEALKADIEQLRSVQPGQSHAMMDVEYHFANLWFAAQAARWDLAGFYLGETRARLGWAVRVRTVRKLANGADLDLRPILQAFEVSSLAPLKTAIDAHALRDFETAYRAALDSCHACHVAAEKPYLRPVTPHAPAAPLIDFSRAR